MLQFILLFHDATFKLPESRYIDLATPSQGHKMNKGISVLGLLFHLLHGNWLSFLDGKNKLFLSQTVSHQSGLSFAQTIQMHVDLWRQMNTGDHPAGNATWHNLKGNFTVSATSQHKFALLGSGILHIKTTLKSITNIESMCLRTSKNCQFILKLQIIYLSLNPPLSPSNKWCHLVRLDFPLQPVGLKTPVSLGLTTLSNVCWLQPQALPMVYRLHTLRYVKISTAFLSSLPCAAPNDKRFFFFFFGSVNRFSFLFVSEEISGRNAFNIVRKQSNTNTSHHSWTITTETKE